MKIHSLLTFFFISMTFASCGGGSSEDSSEAYFLSADQSKLCLAQGIDTNLVKPLLGNYRIKLDVFVPDSVWSFNDQDDYVSRASVLKGVMFSSTADKASDICGLYGENFTKAGYTIYVFEQNFGINNEKDKVAIVNTKDKYEVLRETGTDGLNYDIDNDSVISIIRMFDTKYDLTLTGAGLDWCQFSIGNMPDDCTGFAEEVYDVCPDVVDQGTGSVEELAQEIKRTGSLYFWWD